MFLRAEKRSSKRRGPCWVLRLEESRWEPGRGSRTRTLLYLGRVRVGDASAGEEAKRIIRSSSLSAAQKRQALSDLKVRLREISISAPAPS